MQTNKCKKIKSYSHIKNTYGHNKSNMPSCRVLEHITGGAQRNASSMWCWVTLPVCSALPYPAVLPSGSQQSKFHGKLLFCERCTKCSVLLGADRKRKKRKKREENFVTQSEITLTNENVTMMIIYFGLCQLPSVAPQLLNIPLRWNSRFHLSSPICSTICV